MGDFGSVLGMLAPMMGPDATAFVNNFNETVPPLADVTAWSHLMVERDGIARAWSIFMADRPLLLTPTWTQLPFEHGFDSATPAGTAVTKELMRPVVPANLLGLPSACVPAGRDEETGLPIGVLITGRRLREDLTLSLSHGRGTSSERYTKKSAGCCPAGCDRMTTLQRNCMIDEALGFTGP